MILTLTPNPSTDRTIELAGPLERGGVLRAAAESAQAGGKGINISRAAVAAGVPTLAVIPASTTTPFVVGLLRDGIDCRPITPTGPIRGNITITEPDGTTTKLNSPGPTATTASLAATGGRPARACRPRFVGGAGRIAAPGAPADWYAQLVTALRRTSTKVAVDTSDAPLRELVAGLPARPPT
jgi:1-phosphofructokinase